MAIPVLKADKRFFSLKHRKEGSEEWGIVSDVVVEEGSTIVTLRSILQVKWRKRIIAKQYFINYMMSIPQRVFCTQVHNHFAQPIAVYYMTKRGNEVECVGTVAPDQKLNLPLDAVYTPTNIYWLFFSVEG